MPNEMTTLVPGKPADRTVRGFDPFLTQEDIARILDKPVRWVRERLFRTGVLKTVQFGGASYRVNPKVFKEWIDKGCPGFRRRSS